MASSDGRTGKISLKLLIDEKQSKVLCAIGGKDFVDFLFCLLSLPLAEIINLLGDEGLHGSSGNVYKSLQALGGSYTGIEEKRHLLRPPYSSLFPSVAARILRPQDTERIVKRKDHYMCKCCSRLIKIQDLTSSFSCTVCLLTISTEAISTVEHFNVGERCTDGQPFAGVVKNVKYFITDDLVVTPLDTTPLIPLMRRLLINRDIADLKEQSVTIGVDEGKAILKALFSSRSVFTDVFVDITKRSEPLYLTIPAYASALSETVGVFEVKFIIDKKRTRLLHVQSGRDFVCFLSCLLSLHLDEILNLLEMEAVRLGSLGNILKSLQDLDSSFLSEPNARSDVLLPEYPFGGIKLHQQTIDRIKKVPCYICRKCGKFNKERNGTCTIDSYGGRIYCQYKEISTVEYVKMVADKKGSDQMIFHSAKYVISDDLVFTLLDQSSVLPVMKSLLACCDVDDLEERKVMVGVNEAKAILRAMLSSKTVFTDVFLSPGGRRNI